MVKWFIAAAVAALTTAFYGFSGEFTLVKGVSQVMSYLLLVVILVILVTSFFRGSMK